MVTLKHYAVISVLVINNGFLLQYGYSTGVVTTTFPVMFNKAYCGNICWYDNSNAYRSMRNFTESTIGISGVAMPFYFLAIGI